MRAAEKEVRLSDAALLLESAESAVTDDPATALPKVQDAAAARTDLAGVHAMIDPLTVGAVLDRIDVAALAGLKTAAVEAAQAIFTPERIRRLWEALRTLREATVEAGCDPPLVPYPSAG